MATSLTTSTTSVPWLQRCRAALAGSGSEAWSLIVIGCRALFVERLLLAGAFLLLCWPILVGLGIVARFRGTVVKERVSPFIYTMQ